MNCNSICCPYYDDKIKYNCSAHEDEMEKCLTNQEFLLAELINEFHKKH